MSDAERVTVDVAEREVTNEHVREERLREVDRRAHWTYLLVVLAGSTLLMVGLMALLDATT